MKFRERVKFLSVVALVIGGGGSAVAGVAFLADYYCDCLDEPGHPTGAEFLVLFPITILIMAFGCFLGAAVWMLLMKPFFTREEIRPMVESPYVPIVTPVLVRIFKQIFPNGERGGRN